MKTVKRIFLRPLLLAAAIFALSNTALAARDVTTDSQARIESQRSNSPGAGSYTAALLSSLVYTPAKVVFAGTGATAAGLAYLITLGSKDVSGPMFDAAVNGDYVVTPSMIEDRRSPDFIG